MQKKTIIIIILAIICLAISILLNVTVCIKTGLNLSLAGFMWRQRGLE